MEVVGRASGGSEESDAQSRARMEAWRRRQRPENEVPRSVVWDAVLLESEDLVVFVAGAQVYSTGLEFQVVADARRDDWGADGRPRGLLGRGAGGGGLLLGVEFSDGRAASSVSGGPRQALGAAVRASAREPVLATSGGGGGSRQATYTFFLSPLPPAGGLRLVTAWPERGFGEHSVDLPTDAIVAAAAGVRRLWDVEPPTPPVDRAPQVPPGGWFERHQQRG